MHLSLGKSGLPINSFACIFRLIPSAISVSDDGNCSEPEPVPAPPPGYESQPGFSVVTDELLPQTATKSSHQDSNKCSKNDLESRL